MLLALLLVPAALVADQSTREADPAVGEAVYGRTCVVCHGANGKGALPGVKDFTTDGGPLTKADEALVSSITEGVATPGAPLSMPAKGGDPSLSEAEIRAVIAYLRSAFGK